MLDDPPTLLVRDHLKASLAARPWCRLGTYGGSLGLLLIHRLVGSLWCVAAQSQGSVGRMYCNDHGSRLYCVAGLVFCPKQVLADKSISKMTAVE